MAKYLGGKVSDMREATTTTTTTTSAATAMELFRNSYYGKRTEIFGEKDRIVFKQGFEQARVPETSMLGPSVPLVYYDISSSYPAAMLHPVSMKPRRRRGRR